MSLAEIRGLDGRGNDENGDLSDLYPETFTDSSYANGGGDGSNGNDVGDAPPRNRTKHRHQTADGLPPAPSPSASVRLVPPFFGTFKYL